MLRGCTRLYDVWQAATASISVMSHPSHQDDEQRDPAKPPCGVQLLLLAAWRCRYSAATMGVVAVVESLYIHS